LAMHSMTLITPSACVRATTDQHWCHDGRVRLVPHKLITSEVRPRTLGTVAAIIKIDL